MEQKYNLLFAQWMEGKISDTELKQQVPQEVFLSFLKLKKGLEVYSELEQPVDKSWQKLEQKIANVKSVKPKNNRILRYILPAVSIAAILVLFFAINKYFSTDLITIQTANNQNKTYFLPDQSKVILKANSTLKFHQKNWNKNKEVELEGEAYFEVTKSKKFVVKTANGIVQVLGTHFDVKSYKNVFEATCFEGKVMVKTAQINFLLEQGKGIVRIGNDIKDLKFENQTQPDWLQKYTVFDKTPLKTVLNRIESIYSVKFIRHNINQNRTFTGKIPNDNLKKALRIILSPMEINYQIKDNNILLSKKKKVK